MKELKEEFIKANLNIKKITDYNWAYRTVYIIFAFMLNAILFAPMMIIMFFKHEEFKKVLKEGTRKRILANAEI